QVLVARQTADPDRRRHTVVERGQPPRPCAHHADPGRADPSRVDFGPGAQNVKRDLIVAHHHAPQATAHPQECLRKAELLWAALFLGAIGPAARAFAEAIGVDCQHNVAAPDERLAALAALVRGVEPDFVLPEGVLAGVPVTVEDPRKWPGPF